MDYLDELPLSPSEKEELRQLAVPTPSALLGMIHASPDAFARFFGPQQTERLIERLTASIDGEESERLLRPVHPYPIQASTFSILPAPPLSPPSYTIEDRDRIFTQLQQLKANPHPSVQIREQIAACETKLNSMLD